MHAGSALIMLLIFGVLLLGAYEALAGYVNPEASIRAALQASLAPDSAAAPRAATTWVTIEGPVQTYWLDDREAWVAMPGERYEVLEMEGEWLMVRWEGDSPAFAVWMERHPWVHVGG
jgi:hypothetical protein